MEYVKQGELRGNKEVEQQSSQNPQPHSKVSSTGCEQAGTEPSAGTQSPIINPEFGKRAMWVGGQKLGSG